MGLQSRARPEGAGPAVGPGVGGVGGDECRRQQVNPREPAVEMVIVINNNDDTAPTLCQAGL